MKGLTFTTSFYRILTMTKKHFEAFAEEIKNNVAYASNRQMVADVVIEVAKKFSKRFNEKKFLKACGLTFDTNWFRIFSPWEHSTLTWTLVGMILVPVVQERNSRSVVLTNRGKPLPSWKPIWLLDNRESPNMRLNKKPVSFGTNWFKTVSVWVWKLVPIHRLRILKNTTRVLHEPLRFHWVNNDWLGHFRFCSRWCCRRSLVDW